MFLEEGTSGARQRDGAFIAANWETLAGLAWKGYLRSGRGALQVRESLFLDSAPGTPLLARVHYDTGARGAVAELLRGYDPEREIVCTITGEDGITARTYQLRGPVRPPDAYQESVDAGKQEA